MVGRAGSAHGRPIFPRLSSPRLTLGMAQARGARAPTCFFPQRFCFLDPPNSYATATQLLWTVAQRECLRRPQAARTCYRLQEENAERLFA